MIRIGCMKERGIDGSINMTINIDEITLALDICLDQGVIYTQPLKTN